MGFRTSLLRTQDSGRRTLPRPYTPSVTRTQLITALCLVMVICLGLSALLFPEATDRTPARARLIAFAPSEVARVEVRLPDGSIQTLTRIAPDRWQIELAGNTRWPASTDRVRAFLRILDRSTGIPATETPPPAATTLTITSDLGMATTLGLPAQFLGGRAVVHVQAGNAPEPTPTPTPFITTDELPRLLADDGIVSWLDQRAFAGIEGRVNAITVTSAAETMTITRSGTGWRIGSPFAAPAEASLVAELVAGLQPLPFANAEPSAARSEQLPPGADATTITLTATTRLPLPAGSITTETMIHTLTTTGPVGQSGRVPVSLSAATSDAQPPGTRHPDTQYKNSLGPLAATIDAARLGEIVRRPSFYIARRAVGAQPTDIQSLSLALPDGTTLRVSRTGSSLSGPGWTRDDAPLPAAESAAIEALLALLTQTPATVTAWSGSPPADTTPLATITAIGLGGLTLATVDLAVAPLPEAAEETRAYALLTTGGISRYYAPESAVEAVRWVAGLSGTP